MSALRQSQEASDFSAKASGTVQGSFRIGEKLLSRWKTEMLEQQLLR